MAAHLLTLDNPVFAAYLFYGTLTVFKLFAMLFFTGRARSAKMLYSNPEDKMFFKGEKVPDKPILDDERLKRVHRNHLNDLENIPAFLVVGLFYVFVQPSATAALWHYRLFFFSRAAHTFFYQNAMQPWRAIAFFVGLFSTISMAGQVLMETW